MQMEHPVKRGDNMLLMEHADLSVDEKKLFSLFQTYR